MKPSSIYQPLEHPDYEGVEVLQPCEERWKFITSVGLPKRGSCVDIGCNTGWFCRKFSHLGWNVLGIDTKADLIDIARDTMRPFNGRNTPIYIVGDVVDMEIPECRIALCLSVAMYWFNPQFGKTTEEGWEILRRISVAAPRMYLDYGGQYDTLPQSFPSDIIHHTEYETLELLGYTDFESRPFYCFRRW